MADREDQAAYYAWLPGPWLVHETRPSAPVAEVDVLSVHCAICGLIVMLPSFDLDDVDAAGEAALQGEYEQIAAEARSHWEEHVDPAAARVEYFVLPGVGATKHSRTGDWADVLSDVPYLFTSGAQALTPAAIASVLANGESHAGMSGGCEWPRPQLSTEALTRLSREIAERHG